MNKKQVLLIIGLFLLALVVRVICIPPKAFFCDVPASQLAVETGTMIIQFPGYVPYHLLVKAMTILTGSVTGSLTLFSLVSGILSMLYCVRLAGERAGYQGALLGSVVMGFSLYPVYFSCVGASYAADMLVAAGMVYHGSRFIKGKRALDYYSVLAWFIFGCMMRPLSCICTGMAIAYLLLKQFTVMRAILTSGLLLGGACLFVVISIPFFGSLHNFIADSKTISDQLQGFSKIQRLINLFRVAIYPLWGLHVFLVITGIVLWRSRKFLDFEFGMFLLLMVGPYFGLLLIYIPHAGYYCLLVPVIIALPWMAKNSSCVQAHPVLCSITLAGLFLCQIFFVRPLPTLSVVSLVSNVCLFQYTYTGMKLGMFETLSSLSYKSGIRKDEIPEIRKKNVLPPSQ